MKLSLVQLLFAQIRGMRGKQQKSGLFSPKELKILQIEAIESISRLMRRLIFNG